MGVDVAEVEPGVLSVVCHSVRACHLQLKFVVFSIGGDLLLRHVTFIASLQSDANAEES